MRIPRAELLRLTRKRAGEVGPGLAFSLLLHGLVAAMVLLFLIRSRESEPQTSPKFVPVDVVQLGEKTVAPPAATIAKVPQERALHAIRQEAASPAEPEGTSPRGTRPLPDTFEAKLRALARLKQTQTGPLVLFHSGTAPDSASSDAQSGDEASYSVRDFIRAQVERRWNLDLSALGSRNFLVAIRVEMKRDGTVTKAEIVDRERFTTDAAYHDVALSARNAVLLSSPFTLPGGNYHEKLAFTLELNPRDTLR